MAAPAFSVSTDHSTRLADPALREALLKFARPRLPPGEVEDLVQNTLTDALTASNAPSEDAAFRRWLQGIARHKIADLYRRRGRLPALSAEADASSDDPGPAADELKQWIAQELPKTAGAEATLHWLLRESEGETLDEIARDAALPAPRVRQRVSRLRRHFQTRWLALGAAGLALLLGVGVVLQVAGKAPPPTSNIAPEVPSPFDRATRLRQSALEKCAAAAYRECLAQLDEARALDPIGDQAYAVRDARNQAWGALSPEPTPSAADTVPQRNVGSMPKQPLPAPRVAPKFMKKPLPKKEESPEQKALPNQEAAPLFNDAPSKSNGHSKQLTPSKN
jgi:RNA polymerase sigma factor (sigma-70 family)